ncbi:hypothetical protein B0T19DRAFT_11641 [Cercophora scortea]|uniref:Uncharacterized protein n=1 Tax=Cercophora scortea TaxID=314031 RepID=A0AAE0J279_9PEZI|nr:hypothetical protein B0T19DRAFT_11641 [Cercophora scortea]
MLLKSGVFFSTTDTVYKLVCCCCCFCCYLLRTDCYLCWAQIRLSETRKTRPKWSTCLPHNSRKETRADTGLETRRHVFPFLASFAFLLFFLLVGSPSGGPNTFVSPLFSTRAALHTCLTCRWTVFFLISHHHQHQIPESLFHSFLI